MLDEASGTHQLPAAALPLGQLSQDLKLSRVLGRGAFATVYLARWRGEQVACKVLHSVHSDAPNGQYLKMFLRECAYMMGTSHANVVKGLAVLQLPSSFAGLESSKQGKQQAGASEGRERPTWALILKYCEEGSLVRLLARQVTQPNARLLSEVGAMDIALDVARGLLHLHTEAPRIIHRDIKMENIMLTCVGRRRTAQITDFGLFVRLSKGRTEGALLRRSMRTTTGEAPLAVPGSSSSPRLAHSSGRPRAASTQSFTTSPRPNGRASSPGFATAAHAPPSRQGSLRKQLFLTASQLPQWVEPPPLPPLPPACGPPTSPPAASASSPSTGGPSGLAGPPALVGQSLAMGSICEGDHHASSRHGTQHHHQRQDHHQHQHQHQHQQTPATAADGLSPAAATPPCTQQPQHNPTMPTCSAEPQGGTAACVDQGPVSAPSSEGGSDSWGGRGQLETAGAACGAAASTARAWLVPAAADVDGQQQQQQQQQQQEQTAGPKQADQRVCDVSSTSAGVDGWQGCSHAQGDIAPPSASGNSCLSRHHSMAHQATPATPTLITATGSISFDASCQQHTHRAPSMSQLHIQCQQLCSISPHPSAADASRPTTSSQAPPFQQQQQQQQQRPSCSAAGPQMMRVASMGLSTGAPAGVSQGRAGVAGGQQQWASPAAGVSRATTHSFAASRASSMQSQFGGELEVIQPAHVLDRASAAVRQVKAAVAHSTDRELQWVFQLTGQTGSCIYMSPEVWRKEPYNEKVDVFSYGVLIYELFTRTLLVFTHVGTGKLPGVTTVEGYAAAVSEGYRPERPSSMSDQLWALIQACWHQDPNERPCMGEVVGELEAMRSELSMQEAGPAAASMHQCGCVIS